MEVPDTVKKTHLCLFLPKNWKERDPVDPLYKTLWVLTYRWALIFYRNHIATKPVSSFYSDDDPNTNPEDGFKMAEKGEEGEEEEEVYASLEEAAPKKPDDEQPTSSSEKQ